MVIFSQAHSGPYFMMYLSGFTGNATARTRVTPGDRSRRSQRLIKISGADSRLRISPRSLPRNRAAWQAGDDTADRNAELNRSVGVQRNQVTVRRARERDLDPHQVPEPRGGS